MADASDSSAIHGFTAVLARAGEHDPLSVRRIVAAGPYGDVWLRAHPLPSLGLLQVELFDPNGGPRIDPALVAALSAEGRHAVFVHLNRPAKQALLHSFEDGREVEGWMGTPEEMDARVVKALGRPLAEIVAADDGTRVYPGNAASDTVALTRGRTLVAPVGLPLPLGSFSFHDRNAGRSGGQSASSSSEGGGGGDRVALLAFDGEGLRTSWRGTPGAELAARLKTLPDRVLGPLGGARDAAVAELHALGDTVPEAAGLRSVRALELLLLGETCVFGGGDAAAYVDGRVLPMFSLASFEPQLDDEDEASELESSASVLEAMVEVLPFSSPEGTMLEQIADGELLPLAPWARPGEEYVGSVFLFDSQRLRQLLSGLDQRDLAGHVDRFYRAWWKAQDDGPIGEEFQAWRRELDERGMADIQRFLTDWAEWRAVMEMAAANKLHTALLFYE